MTIKFKRDDVYNAEPEEEVTSLLVSVSFFLILVKIKIVIVDDMNNLIVLVRSILIERKWKGT